MTESVCWAVISALAATVVALAKVVHATYKTLMECYEARIESDKEQLLMLSELKNPPDNPEGNQ